MYKAGVTSPKISVEQDQHKPWRYRPPIHLGKVSLEACLDLVMIMMVSMVAYQQMMTMMIYGIEMVAEMDVNCRTCLPSNQLY